MASGRLAYSGSTAASVTPGSARSDVAALTGYDEGAGESGTLLAGESRLFLLNDDWRDDDRGYSSGYGEDAYRFDLVEGQVTNLQEFDDGRWKQERIDYDETWSFDGTNLIKTERERYGSEISTFSDPDNDGVFTKISEIYAANV